MIPDSAIREAVAELRDELREEVTVREAETARGRDATPEHKGFRDGIALAAKVHADRLTHLLAEGRATSEVVEHHLSRAEAAATKWYRRAANAEALVHMLRERSGPKKLAAAEAALDRVRQWAESNTESQPGGYAVHAEGGIIAAKKRVLSLLPPSNPEPAPDPSSSQPIQNLDEGHRGKGAEGG